MDNYLSITPGEYAARNAVLQHYLAQEELKAAVLFDSTNILYFSGFAFIPTERPVAYIVSRTGERALLVPRLELEHAQQVVQPDRIGHYPEYPGQRHPMDFLGDLLAEMDLLQDSGKLGADNDGYPWIFGYEGPPLTGLTRLSVVDIQGQMHRMQAIKSAAEVALIRESVKWAHLAHVLLQRYTRVGATETEVSLRASHEATLAMLDTIGPLYRAQSMFTNGPGAGYRGQIGRNAAIPHALANNIIFQPGDVLVTGAGCPMWGYNSELERTMFIGEPTAEQRQLFAHMKTAQEIAFAALRPGARCSAVDDAVRAYYERHDLQAYWKHHTGHAIGLKYHEGPYLDSGDPTPIAPGMVFTVEPGFYSAELGGFRHSDTVLVTEDGPELLTYYPRDLDPLIIPC